MGNWFQAKHSSKLFFLAIALFFASCNSYRNASNYPLVNSVDQKKSGFLLKGIHNSAHQKKIKNDYTTVDVSSASRLTPKNIRNESEVKRLQSISLINNVGYTNNWFPKSFTNQETMTASITTVPILIRYYSIPDTSKKHDSLTIDSTQIKTTQIQPTNQYDYFDTINAKKLKQRETFANISLVAAIASIVTLFVIPVLFLPAVIAAIVFGALGLKSSKRKRARNSMIIGIIMIFLLTIFVLAYAGLIF